MIILFLLSYRIERRTFYNLFAQHSHHLAFGFLSGGTFTTTFSLTAIMGTVLGLAAGAAG
jgi:hypothetical protein